MSGAKLVSVYISQILKPYRPNGCKI